jgi:hypothetical protein
MFLYWKTIKKKISFDITSRRRAERCDPVPKEKKNREWNVSNVPKSKKNKKFHSPPFNLLNSSSSLKYKSRRRL